MSACLILQLDFTTLFQLFKSCQKLELKLFTLVTAFLYQVVLALLLLLFCGEELFNDVVDVGGLCESLARRKGETNRGYDLKMGGIKPSGRHVLYFSVLASTIY